MASGRDQRIGRRPQCAARIRVLPNDIEVVASTISARRDQRPSLAFDSVLAASRHGRLALDQRATADQGPRRARPPSPGRTASTRAGMPVS